MSAWSDSKLPPAHGADSPVGSAPRGFGRGGAVVPGAAEDVPDGHGSSSTIAKTKHTGVTGAPVRDEGIRSVRRALQVLQQLNTQPVSTIARLHAGTGLPKPTLVRILRTLEAAGLVEHDDRLSGYQVTAEVTSLSAGYHKAPMVVEAARPWCIALTRRHHWPVAVALYDGDAVVVRFSTVPDSAMSPFHSTLNLRLPLLTRGLGLAYLGFCPRSEQELILGILRNAGDPEHGLAHHPEAVRRLLDQVRADGYATRSPDVEPQSSNTIAVPIFDAAGRVTASLGMTFFKSSFRNLGEACERYVDVLKAAAGNICKDLQRMSAMR